MFCSAIAVVSGAGTVLLMGEVFLNTTTIIPSPPLQKKGRRGDTKAKGTKMEEGSKEATISDQSRKLTGSRTKSRYEKSPKPIHEHDRLSSGLFLSLPPTIPGECRNTSQPAQQLHEGSGVIFMIESLQLL